MVAYTTTYSFAKPTVGDDEDVWGGYLNGNFDTIENLLKGTSSLTSLSLTGTLTAPYLRLTGTGDASASSTTHAFQVGASGGGNIIMDANEIMARSNGAVSSLHLNADGGSVTLHNNTTAGTFTIGGNTVWHAGNDGSGSGLDADTVDGIQASSFLRSDANDSASGDITFTGFVTFDNDTNPAVKIISDNFADGLEIHRNHASYAAAIKFSNTSGQQGILYSNSSGEIVWRPLATTNAYAIWHSGNDGSGSGLDADTVDGIEASSFLRSDANDSFSGVLTSSQTSIGIQFDGAAAWRVSSSDTAHQRADARDTSDESRLHWYGVSTGGASRGFKHAWYDGSAYINIDASLSNINFARTTGTANLQVHGNTVWHAGNDGSGSGLDADTVDGIQASSFLRSDAVDYASNYIVFEDGLRVGTGSGLGTSGRATISFGEGDPTGDVHYIEYDGDNLNGDSNALIFRNTGSGESLRLENGGDIKFATDAIFNGELYPRAQINSSGLYGIHLNQGGWSGIMFSGTNATKSVGMHYGGSNDNQLRLGRYGDNGGAWEANPISFDIDNGYISTTGGIGAGGDISATGAVYTSNWFRTYGEEGLYSHSYGQHIYPDSGGYYWEVNDGGFRVRDAYEGNIKLYMGYHDSGGAGFLNAGGSYWFMSNPSNNTHAILGGSTNYNPYNGVSSTRLMFGGGDTNAQGNYYIGTNLENYGGNYTKLDLRWHTGIRMGAQPSYGGVRIFNNEDLGTKLFSVGETDTHVRVTNNLIVGGTLTVGGVEVGAGGSTHTATASGAIANGDPCIVNSDGTVSAVAATATAPSIGTETQLENFYNSFYRRIATGGGWVVAIYKRQSNYLQARIGAVSGGAITWSSSVFTIYSANFVYAAISYDTNASRFIISYRDNLNGLRYYRAKSMAVSGTISSLSVSFGSEVTLQTGAYNSYMDHVYHPTENKTIAFNRSNSPSSIAYILTCNASNGAVTKDTNTTVNSSYGGGNEVGVCYDSGEDALVFVWEVSSGSELVARAATLSGSTLTFGSEVSVSGSGVASWFADNYNVPIASDGNGNILVTWTNNSNNYAYATLLTLSGTTLTKQNDTLINGSVTTKNTALAYDETQNNFAVMYQDNSSTGKVNTLTVSGTTVSVYGTETQIDSGSTGQTDIAYFSDLGGSVMLYQKGGTNYSYSNHYISTSSSTNMTASNYIGIADAAYANAATATIQVVGSVDDAQSGLTPGQTYYVQKDGSLGTTADSPSVIAGTAVSATEIIVKG